MLFAKVFEGLFLLGVGQTDSRWVNAPPFAPCSRLVAVGRRPRSLGESCCFSCRFLAVIAVELVIAGAP